MIVTGSGGDYIGETANIVVVVEDGSGAVYELGAVAVGLEIKQRYSFSGSDTEHFKLYIENPEESEVDFQITKIVVTLENGTELDIRDTSPSLPTTLFQEHNQNNHLVHGTGETTETKT